MRFSSLGWCFSLADPDLRRGLSLGLGVALLAGTVFAVLQFLTHGNFWYYAGAQLLHHPALLATALEGAGVMLRFAPYLPLVVLGAAVLAFKRGLSARALLYTGMLVMAWLVSLLSYSKFGGYQNNFLPVVVLGPAAAFCVLGDVSSGRRAQTRARTPGLHARRRSPLPSAASLSSVAVHRGY